MSDSIQKCHIPETRALLNRDVCESAKGRGVSEGRGFTALSELRYMFSS